MSRITFPVLGLIAACVLCKSALDINRLLCDRNRISRSVILDLERRNSWTASRAFEFAVVMSTLPPRSVRTYL